MVSTPAAADAPACVLPTNTLGLACQRTAVFFTPLPLACVFSPKRGTSKYVRGAKTTAACWHACPRVFVGTPPAEAYAAADVDVVDHLSLGAGVASRRCPLRLRSGRPLHAVILPSFCSGPPWSPPAFSSSRSASMTLNTIVVPRYRGAL